MYQFKVRLRMEMIGRLSGTESESIQFDFLFHRFAPFIFDREIIYNPYFLVWGNSIFF